MAVNYSQEEGETTDGQPVDIPRIASGEFEEAFQVFSKNNSQGTTRVIPKDTVGIFLKSIGLSMIKADVEDMIRPAENIDESRMKQIITICISKVDQDTDREWPSDTDVLKAFSVFDQELSGHIPVQQLKAFLLRARVGGEEEVEKLIHDNCKIDNEDQILYKDFVQNVRKKLSNLDK